MKSIINKIRSGICRAIGEIVVEANMVSFKDVEDAISEQQHTNELLGQILVRKGLLSREQLVDILNMQLHNSSVSYQGVRKKLGEILIEKAVVSRWQLKQALKTQGLTDKKVGELLIELGYASKGVIEEAISEQTVGATRIPRQTRKLLGELLVDTGRLSHKELAALLQEQQQKHVYLGDLLLQRQYLNEEELEDLLATQIIAKHNGQAVEKKLGEILLESRQVSEEQLELAVKIQGGCEERKLGDILVDLGFLPKKEMFRALRLQKRLATLAMTTVLGVTALNGCAPQVPSQAFIPGQQSGYQQTFQQPGYSQKFQLNQQRPGYQQQQSDFGLQQKSAHLSGPFKALTLESGKQIHVYKNGNKVLHDVPFLKQGEDNTCAQAVMTSMLKYWGVDADYQNIVNENNRFNLPTTHDGITKFLRKKGLKVQDYNGASMNNLIAQINKGRPSIVLLDYGGLTQEHYVIVVGYNQKKGTITLHDSVEGPYIEMNAKRFDKMWRNDSVARLPVFGGPAYKNLIFDIAR